LFTENLNAKIEQDKQPRCFGRKMSDRSGLEPSPGH